MESDNMETISPEENERLIQKEISNDSQQSKRVHEGGGKILSFV